MIRTLGKVYLDGQQFTTDPKIKRNWPSRQSVLPGIEGSVTVQDFDRWAKDMRLTLTSEGNYINHAFKAAIDVMCEDRGATYSYQDYTGIDATVKIISFDPEPTFIRDGDYVLWTYTLELKVMTLIKLDGATYGGS